MDKSGTMLNLRKKGLVCQRGAKRDNMIRYVNPFVSSHLQNLLNCFLHSRWVFNTFGTTKCMNGPWGTGDEYGENGCAVLFDCLSE